MEVEAFPTLRRGGRPREAVRGAGALRMRHIPCGCCPPTAPEARGASFSHARRVGADAPVRPTAPKARNSFPISPEVPLLRRHRNCVSDGILFSVLPEKSMQKRGAGREIALTREKTIRSVVRVIVTLPVKERPSGDRQIGFPERTLNHTSR